MRAVALYQFKGGATPALDRTERLGPTGSGASTTGVGASTVAGARGAGVGAWGAGAGLAGAGKGRLGGAGQCTMCIAGLGADGGPGVAAWGGVHGGAGAGAGAGRGGVRGGEGVGLAVLDNRELLKLESEPDGSAAGSNGRGIATPSESVESETSSSGERSASPGSAERPKRSGMALCAMRDRPGNSSLFHITLCKTMIPPRPHLSTRSGAS
jgi:hypothetical protein